MKPTGDVRKVDELGRVVLPIQLRRIFGIRSLDSMEMFVEGDRIILKKYVAKCVLCGLYTGTILYKQKLVCENCQREMKTVKSPTSL